MSFDVKADSFSINAATGNQSITGLGFQPKIVLFFPSGRTSVGIGAGSNMSFGAAISSTSRFAVTTNAQNAVVTTNTRRESKSVVCIMVNNPATGTGANPLYEADFVSLDADGFTIDITVNPLSGNYRVGYIAMGGDDLTDVAIGNDTAKTTTGTKATTGVGFQPDAIILSTILATGTDGNLTSAGIGFGASSGVGEDGASSVASRDGLPTSETRQWQEADACILAMASAAGNFEAHLDSFDADGFTLDYVNAAFSAQQIFYIALKANVSIKVGSFNSRTSSGNFSEIGVGFQPSAGIFWSVLHPTQAGRDTTDSKMSLGAVTDTNERAVIGWTDQDSVGTSNADNFFSDVLLYQNYDYAQTQLGAIDFVSWDADGFTLDQTDADPTANEIIYILFETAGGLVNANVETAKANAHVFPLFFATPPFIAVIPDQTPGIVTPGLPEYKVRLKNQDGELVAEFDNWRSMSYTHRVNTPGSARFEMDGYDERVAEFSLDGQLEIWRRNLNVELDWYLEWEGFVRTVNDLLQVNAKRSFVAFASGYAHLLKRRIIAYPAGSNGAVKDDFGETVMKRFVYENAGAGATVANGRISNGVFPGLFVEADSAAGINWNGARAYNSLYEECQDIARTTGVDFDIIGIGKALFEFRAYDGQRGIDRTNNGLNTFTGLNAAGNAPVIFSSEFGNMKTPLLSINRSNEVNKVYALGAGVEGDRATVVRTDNDSINVSPWNTLEDTISANEEDSDSGLNTQGDRVLKEKQLKETLSFAAMQLKSMYYGKHYHWGDLITAKYFAVEFDKKIIGVKVTVSKRSKGERIKLEFGDI